MSRNVCLCADHRRRSFLDIPNGPVSRIINQFVAQSVNAGVHRSASFLIELLHITDNMLTLDPCSKTEILFMIAYIYAEYNYCDIRMRQLLQYRRTECVERK